jgi:hypothetical protein
MKMNDVIKCVEKNAKLKNVSYIGNETFENQLVLFFFGEKKNNDSVKFFFTTVSDSSESYKIVVLEKSIIVKMLKKYFGEKKAYSLRDEICKLFVVRHEIGHAVRGMSEDAADRWALGDLYGTDKGREQVILHMEYLLLEHTAHIKQQEDRRATFWAAFQGTEKVTGRRDEHATPFRQSVVHYWVEGVKAGKFNKNIDSIYVNK